MTRSLKKVFFKKFSKKLTQLKKVLKKKFTKKGLNELVITEVTPKSTQKLKLIRILLEKVLKKVKLVKKVLKRVNSLKKVLKKKLRNFCTFLYKVKYVLQKLLDNSVLWLKALLSSIEGGFQSKKTLDQTKGGNIWALKS